MSTAAVSCSPDGAMSGGVKMGLGLTGKLGRAWVSAWVQMMGWEKCMGTMKKCNL